MTQPVNQTQRAHVDGMDFKSEKAKVIEHQWWISMVSQVFANVYAHPTNSYNDIRLYVCVYTYLYPWSDIYLPILRDIAIILEQWMPAKTVIRIEWTDWFYLPLVLSGVGKMALIAVHCMKEATAPSNVKPSFHLRWKLWQSGAEAIVQVLKVPMTAVEKTWLG